MAMPTRHTPPNEEARLEAKERTHDHIKQVRAFEKGLGLGN